MDNSLKNIIFDLHGVLFEYDLNEAGDFKKFKIIDKGYSILNSHFLYDNKCEFYVCTNWSNSIISILKNDFYNIMNIFRGIVTPCQSGAKKPDYKMFTYTIEKYNLEPSECILLDDQEKNVKSATELGMKAIYVNDFNYALDELKKLFNER